MELPQELKDKLAKSQSKPKGRRKKKDVKKVVVGKAFVNSSYNNTMVTLTDMEGKVIAWASAGLAGFKGPKKSTPYAAQIITKLAVTKAKTYGLQEVAVFV